MTDWSSWIQENPLVAVIGIIFGGPLAVGALSLFLVPIFILAEASALLGFFAFFVLVCMGAFGMQQLRSDNGKEQTDTADPVTELEQRYVRGELSDEEFEHRLDKIIETEDTVDRLNADSPVGRNQTRTERQTETELN